MGVRYLLAKSRDFPNMLTFLRKILVRMENHKQITKNWSGLRPSEKSLFSLMVLGKIRICLDFRLGQGDSERGFSYL